MLRIISGMIVISNTKSGSKMMLVSKILIVIALFTVLCGCSTVISDSEDRIERPSNLEIPVAGTWRLKDCLDAELDEESMAANEPPVGDTISLSAQAISFSGNYYEKVSYKIKRVNVNEYFLHKNGVIPEKFSFNDNEAYVITVYSDDNFLLEFIKGSNDKIIAVIEDRYYCMEKISDKSPGVQNITNGTTHREEYLKEKATESVPRSGLMLGVRIPVKTEDGLGDYIYGTYWISSTDRTLGPVYYADDIYLPRMDGFWKVRMEKRLERDGTQDTLVAAKVSSKEKAANTTVLHKVDAFSNTTERIETSLRKEIVYIGNDYVCVENTVYDTKGEQSGREAKKTLRTLPIDNLDYLDGITISDLTGESGSIAMESAISELMEKSGQNVLVSIDEKSQEKNFALYRKTGHWFFKGRVDLGRQGQLPYVDFNLNLIPPANMVAYDILQIPWTEMKDKLPHAVDIYTSPNQDIAVVLTTDEILIYGIENKKLASEPLDRYTLREGSSVIMAEWSLSEYVPSWEKSFLKNNETILLSEK